MDGAFVKRALYAPASVLGRGRLIVCDLGEILRGWALVWAEHAVVYAAEVLLFN